VSKTIDLSNKRIVISRTDSIGDVLLTQPMCAWIKDNYPDATILFLGRDYTQSIVACFPSVDEFYSYDELEMLPVQARAEAIKTWKADVFIHVFPNKELAKIVKRAKINIRVGTSHRSYHLLNCTHRINFTRKNSEYHEAQLNFELLKPFGLSILPKMEEIAEWSKRFTAPKTEIQKPEKSDKFKHIVLHPKSKGSAVEWPLCNYMELALALASKGHHVCFSGTKEEGNLFRQEIPQHERIKDVTGEYTLPEFIDFLNHIDVMIACSTGPLHIASALGKNAIGLYVNKRPIHPGRWAPIGENARVICPETKNPKEDDILEISVGQVLDALV
jgi:heptosyltransferase III